MPCALPGSPVLAPIRDRALAHPRSLVPLESGATRSLRRCGCRALAGFFLAARTVAEPGNQRRRRSRWPVPQRDPPLLQAGCARPAGVLGRNLDVRGVPVTSPTAFMALRFLEYGNELYREVRAHGVVGEGDPCPVLCVLLHNGRSRWTAPTSAAATLSMPAALGRAVVPPGLVAFHPWGYFPLDFVAQRDRPHIPGDIISMMVGIEFATKRADLVAPLWETVRQLADDDLRARWHAGSDVWTRTTI